MGSPLIRSIPIGVGSHRLINKCQCHSSSDPMCPSLPPLGLSSCINGNSHSRALSVLDKPVLCPVDFLMLVPSCTTSPACHYLYYVKFITDSVHHHRLTFLPCHEFWCAVGSRVGGLGGIAYGCLIKKRELAPTSLCFLYIYLVSLVTLLQLSCHCCWVSQHRLKPHSHRSAISQTLFLPILSHPR